MPKAGSKLKMPGGMNIGEMRIMMADKYTKGFKKPGKGAQTLSPSGKSRHHKV